jgi:hypothetical protein
MHWIWKGVAEGGAEVVTPSGSSMEIESQVSTGTSAKPTEWERPKSRYVYFRIGEFDEIFGHVRMFKISISLLSVAGFESNAVNGHAS